MRKLGTIFFTLLMITGAFIGGWFVAQRFYFLRQPAINSSNKPPSIAVPEPPTPLPVEYPEPSASATPSDDLRITPVVRAVQKASPAVVNINTTRIQRVPESPFGGWFNDPFFNFFERFFETPEREYTYHSLGTGFIIHNDGYIVTNDHVIARATNIQVKMADGQVLEARVVGTDSENDLAVLKVQTDKALPTLETGNSDKLLIGEPVIAIGNPFGFDHTVTTGVISALHRSVKTEKTVYRDFIQTDAAINPGNSGGPLLNIYGQVIGVNTAILAQGEGIGFAIPINLAVRIVNDLITFGKVRQTWWGLRLSERPPINGRPQVGLRVEDVIPGSPADDAGLVPGDIILSINNENLRSLDDFYRIWVARQPGETVRLKIRRAGKTLSLTVKLRALTEKEAETLVWNLIGFRGVWLSEREARRYGLPSGARYVLTEVREGSPAEKIGFEKGDVIYQINDQLMTDKDQLIKAAVTLPQREIATVRVIRGRFIYTVNIPLIKNGRLRAI